MLDTILTSIVGLDEFDCRGIYLVDDETGALELKAHQRLPESFVDRVRHIDEHDPRVQLVMAGKPLHGAASDFSDEIRRDLASIGISSLAVIPSFPTRLSISYGSASRLYSSSRRLDDANFVINNFHGPFLQ